MAWGAALDERSIYIFARLSPRYPTVEVRVADVCLDTGTAVLVAGLTRALVATALAEARQGTPVAAAPACRVAAALNAAARHGLAGNGTHTSCAPTPRSPTRRGWAGTDSAITSLRVRTEPGRVPVGAGRTGKPSLPGWTLGLYRCQIG
jgi:hypothetical protein